MQVSARPTSPDPSPRGGTPPAGAVARGGRGTPEGFKRSTWHRKATKPVTWWLIALVVVVFTHPIIPQFRWLLVHMVTLGLVTTSIMVWGQHFTEALLKTRLGEESRPTQVRRIYLLTASIAVTIVGMVFTWPWVTVVGALGVSAMILWYAFALGAQIKAALAPRFTFVVRAYLTAACLLPVGAVLGAILAFSPGEPWQGRLLLAHQVVNVLGFVGITATATMLTLWPTVLRTKLDGSKAKRASRSLTLMLVAVLIAVTGALVNNVLVGVAGIVLYMLGQVSIMALLVALARRAARQERRESIPLFSALSIGAGALWFVGTTLALGILWGTSAGGGDGAAVASPLNFSVLASDLQELTVPFVVGFLLQLLLGAMSFLMPTAMGGGPRALRASLAVMSRGAVFRVVVLNLALALFAFASIDGALGAGLFGFATLGIFSPAEFGSVTRVVVSLAAFAVLVAFIMFMVRMVKVNLKERLEFQERVALGMPTAGLPSRGTDISGTETVALRGASAPAGAGAGADAGAEAGAGAGARARTGAGAGPGAGAPSLERRRLTGALLGAGSVLGLAAVGRAFDGTLGVPRGSAGGGAEAPAAASSVKPTGNTTRVKVNATDKMRFVPASVDVPAGDKLVIELHNADPANAHDLVLATGAASPRVNAGESVTLDAGVITASTEGWCSIVGHRSMGMTFTVNAVGAEASSGAAHADHAGHGAGAAGVGDPLARVTSDLAAAPGAGYTHRSPVLPAPVTSPHTMTIEVTEKNLEIAPGVAMESMVFDGAVMGPTIVSPLGGKINLTLVNKGTMGHSIDFHAGTVSPTTYMKTIANGESINYPFTTDYAGMWLYHCSTAPMTVHLSSGMYGALVVKPQGLQNVDREYYLVQSDHYLNPQPTKGAKGPEGTKVYGVSSDKIFAERPDFTVFNGHASQYRTTPLEAKVGERVRIWVLAAGPSRGISFHVVGTVFDTVFKEGEYLLRPDNMTGGGSQALDLAACQGGFVEMVFKEPGQYKAVNHSFVDLERGALAIINVTK